MKALREESGLPSAARFVRDQLRAANYTFDTAIADLVDNSLSAGAENIELFVDYSRLEVMLLDDGKGMSDITHFESMKVAAETREYEEKDLGKYGTGMKAASLSQASRLVVATRQKGKKPITVRCLDVDHVVATNDWNRVTQVLHEDALPSKALKFLESTSGTVIIWQNLDKVFAHKNMTDAQKSQELLQQIDTTAYHLSAVFHRFMSGENTAKRKTNFRVNGTLLEPWDPFARQEQSMKVSEETIAIGDEGGVAKVTAWVLPGEKEFSSSSARLVAKGPKSWNDSQGFYAYRNDRLISYGGWFGMKSKEPHRILARVSFEFNSDLDEALHVPVNKSSVRLPQSVKADLEPIVRDVSIKAEKRYRSQSQLQQVTTAALARASAGNIAKRKLTAISFFRAMQLAASQNHLETELLKLMNAVKVVDPNMTDEVGWRANDH